MRFFPMLLEQKLTTQIFRELFARSFVQVVIDTYLHPRCRAEEVGQGVTTSTGLLKVLPSTQRSKACFFFSNFHFFYKIDEKKGCNPWTNSSSQLVKLLVISICISKQKKDDWCSFKPNAHKLTHHNLNFIDGGSFKWWLFNSNKIRSWLIYNNILGGFVKEQHTLKLFMKKSFENR